MARGLVEDLEADGLFLGQRSFGRRVVERDGGASERPLLAGERAHRNPGQDPCAIGSDEAHLPVAPGVTQRGADKHPAHGLDEVRPQPAQELVAVTPEDPRGCWIREHETRALVEDEDPVDGRLDRPPQAFLGRVGQGVRPSTAGLAFEGAGQALRLVPQPARRRAGDREGAQTHRPIQRPERAVGGRRVGRRERAKEQASRQTAHETGAPAVRQDREGHGDEAEVGERIGHAAGQSDRHPDCDERGCRAEPEPGPGQSSDGPSVDRQRVGHVVIEPTADRASGP